MKYILVSHNWHVHSNGFDYKIVNVNTEDEAERERKIFKSEKDVNFSRADVVKIRIEDNGKIYKPRKLTVKERLSGYLEETE